MSSDNGVKNDSEMFYEHNMTMNWCRKFAVNLAISLKVCHDLFTEIFIQAYLSHLGMSHPKPVPAHHSQGLPFPLSAIPRLRLEIWICVVLGVPCEWGLDPNGVES